MNAMIKCCGKKCWKCGSLFDFLYVYGFDVASVKHDIPETIEVRVINSLIGDAETTKNWVKRTLLPDSSRAARIQFTS